jgi:hypothetical protein
VRLPVPSCINAINPLCPTCSVVGLAKVTLPVSVNTKFCLAAKSSVTEPVLVVSVSVVATAVPVTVTPFAVVSSFLTAS